MTKEELDRAEYLICEIRAEMKACDHNGHLADAIHLTDCLETLLVDNAKNKSDSDKYFREGYVITSKTEDVEAANGSGIVHGSDKVWSELSDVKHFYPNNRVDDYWMNNPYDRLRIFNAPEDAERVLRNSRSYMEDIERQNAKIRKIYIQFADKQNYRKD